ncbi:hypothetical protein [Paenibacillus swuensis]|nr:hypothetical protein [Paenibacillus swuensis]
MSYFLEAGRAGGRSLYVQNPKNPVIPLTQQWRMTMMMTIAVR